MRFFNRNLLSPVIIKSSYLPDNRQSSDEALQQQPKLIYLNYTTFNVFYPWKFLQNVAHIKGSAFNRLLATTDSSGERSKNDLTFLERH